MLPPLSPISLHWTANVWVFYDVSHNVLWLFYDVLLVVHDVLLLFHDVLWCFMVFHDVLWCLTMFYDVSWVMQRGIVACTISNCRITNWLITRQPQKWSHAKLHPEIFRSENRQLSVWGVSLLELCGNITIKIERAFSVILWASLATSPQAIAVAVTSGNSPALVSGKSFLSAKLGSCYWFTGGCLEWLHFTIILLLQYLKGKIYRVLKNTFNSIGILIAW